MNEQTDAISNWVLELWRERLHEEQATPILLLALVPGQNRHALVCCTRDDPTMTHEVIAGFLRAAANMLDPGGTRGR